MQIRTSRVRRNGKVYEYAQLVESYRRESDGMPMHRVIATVRDAVAAQNLRDALDAARNGRRVTAARRARVEATKPTANLQYLDLAVLLELWRETGVAAIVEELLPAGGSTVPVAAVVAALTLHRCVDPGSKLHATRWLGRTALPELLGIAPTAFNNTRLHRVLEELDDVTTSLMAKLPARYVEREGKFASLFLDVSDTWFVGEGPSIARSGKTKEGMVRRKVGILLLCNEHGCPLRWDVVEGTQHDSVAMSAMLRSISGLSWASETPIVCDRAMGKTAHLHELLATGLRFLTAMTVNEFDAYATALPHTAFAKLDSSVDVEELSRVAEKAGMLHVRDDLFVLDLGVIERVEGRARPRVPEQPDTVIVDAMRLCREIHEAIGQRRFSSIAAAGRASGLHKRLASKYCALSALSEQQQRDVLDGKVHATLTTLLSVAAITDVDRRAEAFDALLQTPATKMRRKTSAPSAPAAVESPKPIRVRVAAYFNPERYLDERRHAREQLAAIERFTAEVNARLATARSRLTQQSVCALVDRMLRKASLLDAFDIRIELGSDKKPRRLTLVLNEGAWERRRRYDGFSVLVGHPDLPHTAAELCKLYRAKDAVEKDFQVIKSVVEVRPVRHRDDSKVRAHVTLCMLALLLERALTLRLRDHKASAQHALETLGTCHLNLFRGDQSAVYLLTQLDQEQRGLLRSLRMLHLADDDALAPQLTPR